MLESMFQRRCKRANQEPPTQLSTTQCQTIRGWYIRVRVRSSCRSAVSRKLIVSVCSSAASLEASLAGTQKRAFGQKPVRPMHNIHYTACK